MTTHLTPVPTGPPTSAEIALREAAEHMATLEREMSGLRDALARAQLALAAGPPTPIAAPRAYSINAAARVLGIGRSTLYELIGGGHIATVRLAGTKILSEEIDRYLASLSKAAS